MLYHYAMLSAPQVEKITSLEQELGTTLVAFQAQDVALDELTPGQMSRIQQLEDEMGLSLLAVTSGRR